MSAPAGVLFAVVGCGGIGGQSEGNAAAANQADAVANRAAAAAPADAGVTTSRSLAGLIGADGRKDPGAIQTGAGGRFDPQLLVGRWADDDTCKAGVELRPDGTFQVDGGGEGTWSLDGDRLTLASGGNDVAWSIQSVEGDVMTVVNSDGSIGRSRRC